ncbi:MAG: creatininase family protein [Candidatus Thorarchaeota archaeon]|nr:MAG: creatininase family protein [Candidatus Thorarchaeota archaeon]
MEKKYLLAKMTWPEVEEILKETDIALVPIGSTEQHGPALPVDNDAFIATELTLRIAEKIWSKQKVVVTPTITFGYSPHHMDFKGTITLSESTLANVIVDVCKSLEHHGFNRIILVNGHGGNETALSNALHTMSGVVNAKIFVVDWWSMGADKIREVATPPVYHACDMETSLAWHLNQRVLDEKRIDEPGRSIVPGFIEPDMLAPPPRASTAYVMKDITDSGVVGYSTKATKEKGKQVADVVLERLEDFILKIAEA